MVKKAKKSGGSAPGKSNKAGSSKISRELRAAIDKIGELAKEPLAREIVVAAAGAALAASKDARKAAKKAARAAGDAIDESPVAAGWLGAAVTAAAIEAGRRLLDAYDKSDARSASHDGNADGGTAKPRKSAKPSRSARTSA